MLRWKKILTLPLFVAAMWPSASSAGSAIALCYHTFADRPAIDYDVSPENFTNQLLNLGQKGYKFVFLNDILSNRTKGDLNILLTIDDAGVSIKSIWPFLVRHSIKPVIFVYPAIVSRMNYALTWEDLQKMVREGASIGGHGYNHLYVNQKLFDTDPQAFNREVYLCGKIIRSKLDVSPVLYAYPFGVFSDITKEQLKLAGYRYAFSLRNGDLKLPISGNPDPMNLPRYMVTKSSWKWVWPILVRRTAEPAKDRGK